MEITSGALPSTAIISKVYTYHVSKIQSKVMSTAGKIPYVYIISQIGLQLIFQKFSTPGLEKTWGPRLFPVLIPYLSRTKPVFSTFRKNTVFLKTRN